MLASRPTRPDNCRHLLKDAPCIYEMYKESITFRSLFNHSFFASEEWESIKQAVREAENAVHSLDIELPVPMHNVLGRFMEQDNDLARSGGKS